MRLWHSLALSVAISSAAGCSEETERGSVVNAGGAAASSGSAGSAGFAGSAATRAVPGHYVLTLASTQEKVYVRVVEPTRAFVAYEFSKESQVDILSTGTTTLSVDPARGFYVDADGPPKLSAPFVLGDIGIDRGSDGGFGSRAIILRRVDEVMCMSEKHGWRLADATVEVDTTAPKLELDKVKMTETAWDPRMPWEPVAARVSKPISPPLGEVATFSTAGKTIAAKIVDPPYPVGLVSFPEWWQLSGASVSVQGTLEGLNGVSQSFNESIGMFDFGTPVTGLTMLGTHSDLHTWGTVLQIASSSECPDGCLQLSPESGLAMRVSAPGMQKIKIKYATGALEPEIHFKVVVASPGAPPQSHSMPPSENGFVVRDLAFPAVVSDAFVVVKPPHFSVPTQLDPECDISSGAPVLIESISP